MNTECDLTHFPVRKYKLLFLMLTLTVELLRMEEEPSFAESLHGDELDPVEVDESIAIDLAPPSENEADVEVDRDGAEAAYQAALNERNSRLTACLTVQNKLADYFKRKKIDAEKAAPKLNAEEAAELDIAYHARIRSVDQANEELSADKAEYKMAIDELDTRKSAKLNGVNDEWEALLTRKREVVKKCVFARSGAKISSKEMDQMEELERRKNDELAHARLDFIKLKNRKEAREQALQQREQLGEGLHMIDYEQLKIENQTYNEKVEERNEDLLKFNAKINATGWFSFFEYFLTFCFSSSPNSFKRKAFLCAQSKRQTKRATGPDRASVKCVAW